MHHLHLMTVRAESHDEACSIVESLICEWGDENNWRTICGSVCEDDTSYDCGDGRWTPSEYKLKDIEKMVKEWVTTFDNEEEALAIMTTVLAGGEPENMWDWYKLKKYAEDRYESSRQGDDFDLWKVSYYDYQFDHCGITPQLDEDDEGKRYIVFIDMHS